MIRDITDPNDPRHGTFAGHRAHDRAEFKSCEPCLKARNEWIKSRNYEPRQRVECSVCGASCRSRNAICGDCQAAASAGRPKHGECIRGCGRTTHREGGVCRRCDEKYASALTEADLLLDGRWVTRRRNGWPVQVWVAA